MSDVLSATDVGNVVAYIAPGSFALWTYRARFPARDRPAGELLVASTVLSLPFVALAQKLVGAADRQPTSLKYIFALLGPAVLVGFFAAVARSSDGVRNILGGLGFEQQPEPSMWLRTLQYLPKDAWITINFKDGSALAGVPRSYPGLPEDGVNEILLLYPEWRQPDGTFAPGEGAGVIVRLEEVQTITLERDPTAPELTG
jgi:hypothetical protein